MATYLPSCRNQVRGAHQHHCSTAGRALDLSEAKLTLGVDHAMRRLRERLHVRLGTELADVMLVFRHSAIPPALSNEVKPVDIVWSCLCMVGLSHWSPGSCGTLAASPEAASSIHCLLPSGARCCYQFRHTGYICGSRQDPAGLHVGACGFANRIHKHNVL